MKTTKDKDWDRLQVEKLNEELFLAVQASQGFAFISDGIGAKTPEEFFTMVRNARDHTTKSFQIIESFLAKHGQGQGVDVSAKSRQGQVIVYKTSRVQ